MTPTPAQIGQRIQHVRKDMGFGISDLARMAQIPEDVLRATEDGACALLPRDLIALAHALNWDWEAFLDSPEGFSERVLTLFRQNEQLTAKDRLSLSDLAARAGALPRLTDKLKPGLAPVEPPRGKFHRGNGRQVAHQVRDLLRLGDQPIDNPFGLLRHHGVQLFRVEFSTPSLSGATLVHPDFGAAVVIRKQDDLFRQCFSAMHEWGHVLMDRELEAIVSFEDTKGDDREHRANGFAAGMLLPDGPLRLNWSRWGERWDQWREFLVTYRANFGTLFYALSDAGLVNKDKRVNFFSQPNPPSIERACKEDPDHFSLSLGGLERLELCARLGVSPELADAAIECLRDSEPPSWAWVAEQMRLSMEDMRELALQPPHNLKQPLATDINPCAF
jgi:Zn-dependent peptidase ImmA (M78 family)